MTEPWWVPVLLLGISALAAYTALTYDGTEKLYGPGKLLAFVPIAVMKVASCIASLSFLSFAFGAWASGRNQVFEDQSLIVGLVSLAAALLVVSGPIVVEIGRSAGEMLRGRR